MTTQAQDADGLETEMALADGALAVAGVSVLAISTVSVVGFVGLLGGLLALAVVTAMAVVGAYTSVVGTKTTPASKWLGSMVAVAAGGYVLYIAESVIALVITAAIITAGLGRTASWRLRLLGISCLVAAALLLVGAG